MGTVTVAEKAGWRSVQLVLTEHEVEVLRLLGGTPAAALARLMGHVCAGIEAQPGEPMHGWLDQAFGSKWRKRVVVDRDAAWGVRILPEQ